MSHGKLSCFLSKDIYVIPFYYYYFFKLLSWCSYRWRFVVKDKDGGYHGSRWQFAVTFPRHHDHHLVWEETEFEQRQQQQKPLTFVGNLLSFVRNKNVMSELYFHGRELCKSKYNHCPHQYLCTCMYCKLGAKIRTVTIMSHSGLLFVFYFSPFALYSYLPLSIPPPLSLRKHAKINDNAVIQMRRMVCT